MRSIRDHYEARYANSVTSPGGAHPTLDRLLPRVLDLIGSAPCRVLEFGCNRGHAVRALSHAGHQVVGVDVSASILRVAATEPPPGASFVRIDSHGTLPFADDSFDVCFSSEVIEHLFDVRGFLDEMSRVLRQNGLLLLTTPYHGRVKNLLVAALNFERHFNPTGGHLRFFTPRSLGRCLNEAGFTIDRISGIGRCWPIWKLMFAAARKMPPR